MKFLLIVKRDKFTIIDPNRNNEVIYINGEQDVLYEPTKAKICVENMVNALVDEYNLESKNDVQFKIFTNGDANVNKALERYANEDNMTDIKNIIKTIYKQLSENKDLLINEYGLNYDGINYSMINGNELSCGKFKLLAYVLQDEYIIKYFQ